MNKNNLTWVLTSQNSKLSDLVYVKVSDILKASIIESPMLKTRFSFSPFVQPIG